VGSRRSYRRRIMRAADWPRGDAGAVPGRAGVGSGYARTSVAVGRGGHLTRPKLSLVSPGWVGMRRVGQHVGRELSENFRAAPPRHSCRAIERLAARGSVRTSRGRAGSRNAAGADVRCGDKTEGESVLRATYGRGVSTSVCAVSAPILRPFGFFPECRPKEFAGIDGLSKLFRYVWAAVCEF
jgi:hypothetical protein